MSVQSPNPSRRALLSTGLCLGIAPASALAQTAPDWRSLPRGEQSPLGAPDFPFRASYLVEYWKRAAPGSVPADETPAGRLPSQVDRKLPPLDIRGSNRSTAAQQQVFTRRLELIRDAFLAQPSLSDPRGCAVRFIGRIRAATTGEDANRTVVILSMYHHALSLDPASVPSAWEININMNGMGRLRGKVFPTFDLGPNALFTAQMEHGVYWASPALGPLRRLPLGVHDETNLNIPQGGDPTAIHFLHAASASNGAQSAMQRGELSPTHPHARGIAAMYMIDWPTLVAAMRAIR